MTERKGLFITFEGIRPTIFDSQVALHARAMKKHNVVFEIWAFETWPGMLASSRARLSSARSLSQSEVQLFRGLFVYLPFSEVINALLLIYHLVRLHPDIDFVHARADYSAAVCGCACRLLRIPIIWDCRGDSEAEFRTAYQPQNIFGSVIRSLYLRLIKWRTHLAGQSCTRAIFVSEELRARKWKYSGIKRSEVIPTSVPQDTFFFSEGLRRTTRRRFGFESGQRILIYSGGMVGYQSFAEYVRMFLSLYESDPCLHFLVVTPHIKRASAMLKDLADESYTLISASFKEMNALYNSADFGVLLREQNAVNDVASPTKFGEYCLTGLPVIMNDSVKQSLRFASAFGNLIRYDENLGVHDLVTKSATERHSIAQKAGRVLSRESVTAKYCRIYNI